MRASRTGEVRRLLTPGAREAPAAVPSSPARGCKQRRRRGPAPATPVDRPKTSGVSHPMAPRRTHSRMVLPASEVRSPWCCYRCKYATTYDVYVFRQISNSSPHHRRRISTGGRSVYTPQPYADPCFSLVSGKTIRQAQQREVGDRACFRLRRHRQHGRFPDAEYRGIDRHTPRVPRSVMAPFE
jgi:hypothetical protein